MRFAVLVLVTAAALAQQPGGQPRAMRQGRPTDGQVQQQQATPQKPGVVRGSVVSATGEPLKKAEVTLRAQGRGGTGYSTTTDANGSFTFASVEPGTYAAIAQRNGYVSGDLTRRSLNTVTVTAGQEASSVVLKLTPQGVITGRVSDEDGDALAFAQV